MRRKLKKIDSLYTITAFIKGKLQTQKAKRELANYRAQAERRFFQILWARESAFCRISFPKVN